MPHCTRMPHDLWRLALLMGEMESEILLNVERDNMGKTQLELDMWFRIMFIGSSPNANEKGGF